jgi:hypothetical protein
MSLPLLANVTSPHPPNVDSKDLKRKTEAKALHVRRFFAARLKACPDTKRLPGAVFGLSEQCRRADHLQSEVCASTSASGRGLGVRGGGRGEISFVPRGTSL